MKTIVIMVSIGRREHLTDITYYRLSRWASRHNYTSVLFKNDINYLNRTPHFVKLIVHKEFPQFDRYIIVDDDILISNTAPAMEDVPEGFIGLCRDGEQNNTELPLIKWTANSGFIVADKNGTYLLEKAYTDGEYIYKHGDKTGKGIWGPFDQGIVNYVLFKEEKIYQLNSKWNCQFIIEYYLNDKGWEVWRTSKVYRLTFYLKLLLPWSKTRRTLNEIHGLHMTMGTYTKFFNRVFS